MTDKWLAAIAAAQHKVKLAKLRRQTSPIPPSAMSVEQAVAYTGLGRTTLYNMIADGTLPSFKIGRRRFVKISVLKTLMGDGE